MRALAERLWNGWNGFFDDARSLRSAALLRIAIGPVVVAHLWPFLSDMADGAYYADFYYSPWNDWIPHLPRQVYFALLGGCVLAAALVSFGLFTRAATLYTFAFVAYNVFLSQVHYRHNRFFLVLALGFLALVPCGRLLSLDSLRKGRPAGDALASLWPMYLFRFEAVSIYLASTTSKLLNPDWRSGLVTWDRSLRYRPQVEASILPEWAVEFVMRADFHYVFAKVAIASEYMIAIGLLFRPTRYAALWVALPFHATIEATLNVQVFSSMAIAALVIWVTPRTRGRRVTLSVDGPGGRFLDLCLRYLDWFARFDVQRTDPGGGSPVELVETDGRVLRGPAAAQGILMRCPLFFWPVAPFALPGLRRLWDRGLSGVF